MRSNLFFSERAYRQRIKSPIEFAVEIVRGLEGLVGTARLGEDLATLGQNVVEPPTSRGWAGGRDWINRFTLLGRGNLVLALLSNSKPYESRLDPLAVATKHGHATPERAAQFLLDVFLQGDLHDDVREAIESTAREPAAAPGMDLSQRLRLVAHLVLSLPEFQLS